MAKTVLVTGASRGLGREIAKLFAQNNYNVVINYNNSLKEAECLKEELEHLYHVKTLLVKCNIANEDEVKNMIAKIKSEFSTIDVLVNNAGIALDNSLEEKTSLEFQSVLNINVIGTFLVTKYSLEILKKGAIINIASTDGIDTGYIEGIDYKIKDGKMFDESVLKELLSIDTQSWLDDVENIKEFYAKFDPARLPKELKENLAKLEQNLKASK